MGTTTESLAAEMLRERAKMLDREAGRLRRIANELDPPLPPPAPPRTSLDGCMPHGMGIASIGWCGPVSYN